MPPDVPRRAIVLADGAVPSRADLDAAWPAWDEGVAFVVAADGGIRHAGPLGLTIDSWIGDGDSIDPAALEELEHAGVPVQRLSTEKDASDTELALEVALEAAVQQVILLGALGGSRLDHAVSNLGLLGHPSFGSGAVSLYDEFASRVSLLSTVAGPISRDFEGRVGDTVSLVPAGGDAFGVTTDGLRFPLDGERLDLGRTRGVSNVRTAPVARVTLEGGQLLVIETPANLRS
jgi:thiamine pyrophosphokinase